MLLLLCPSSTVSAEEALVDTVHAGNTDLVQKLLTKGINPNQARKNGFTALHTAAYDGNDDIVAILLDAGARVDPRQPKSGITPLHCAAAKGHASTARLLISRGANLEARRDHGRTPLHDAAGAGHIEVVRALLDEGAQIDAKGDGDVTPLHIAAASQRVAVSDYLIQRGASVDARTNDADGRWTPLHFAAGFGDSALVRVLMDRGAKDAPNKWGRRPSDIAQEKGHGDLASQIRASTPGKIAASNVSRRAPSFAMDGDEQAKEAETLSSTSFSSQDEIVRGRVPAKLDQPITQQQGRYALSLEIGATRPMRCEITREVSNIATRLFVTANQTFPDSGKAGTPDVVDIDAGALSGSPFISLVWGRYQRQNTTGADDMRRLKQLVAVKNGWEVYCDHDEVGYAMTFRRVAQTLVEQLALGGSRQPSFVQVDVLTIKGKRTGIEVVEIVAAANGSTRIEKYSSLLIPSMGRGLYMASDVLIVESVDANGALSSSAYNSWEKGESVANLDLARATDGGWTVTGSHHGTHVSGRIEGSPEIESFLSTAAKLRSALITSSPQGLVVGVSTWNPEKDPTALRRDVTRIQSRIGENRYQFSGDGGTAGWQGVIDSEGLVESRTAQLHGTVREERVFRAGSLKLPTPVSQ